MKKETYDITGMSCAACSARIEKGISGMEGMQQCSVNLLKNSMTVDYDETKTGLMKPNWIPGKLFIR